MKNLGLALAVCFCASNAFGGNEGPNAAPQAPPQVIAEVSVSSFFMPPGEPRTVSVQVLPTGKVVRTKYWDAGKSESETIAVLSKAVTANLKVNAEAVVDGPLVDPNPGSGECMDAPSTSYLANKGGKLVMIMQNSGCKVLRTKDFNSADYTIADVLKGLLALASIRQP